MIRLHYLPRLPALASITSDFDFLQGGFDVSVCRLHDPLDPTSGWYDQRATSVARTHFAGAVNIDEMWFAEDQQFGLSLRVFDPGTSEWAVYWVPGRTGQLQSPVRGVWIDGRCWFTGPDEVNGQPIVASYAWSRLTDDAAHWEQSFSLDGGDSWFVNWTMDFFRRTEEPHHRSGPRACADFDFLTGPWAVRHRRLLQPLHGGAEWVEFDARHEGGTYFNGTVSVDEVGLGDSGGRGLTFRTYDPLAGEWSIYWVNSAGGGLQPPVVGRFTDGIGTFTGAEEIGGKTVHVRFVWDQITGTTARWRQYFKVEGTTAWQPNWEMHFSRDASWA